MTGKKSPRVPDGNWKMKNQTENFEKSYISLWIFGKIWKILQISIYRVRINSILMSDLTMSNCTGTYKTELPSVKLNWRQEIVSDCPINASLNWCQSYWVNRYQTEQLWNWTVVGASWFRLKCRLNCCHRFSLTPILNRTPVWSDISLQLHWFSSFKNKVQSGSIFYSLRKHFNLLTELLLTELLSQIQFDTNFKPDTSLIRYQFTITLVQFV